MNISYNIYVNSVLCRFLNRGVEVGGVQSTQCRMVMPPGVKPGLVIVCSIWTFRSAVHAIIDMPCSFCKVQNTKLTWCDSCVRCSGGKWWLHGHTVVVVYLVSTAFMAPLYVNLKIDWFSKTMVLFSCLPINCRESQCSQPPLEDVSPAVWLTNW